MAKKVMCEKCCKFTNLQKNTMFKKTCKEKTCTKKLKIQLIVQKRQ